jgi:glycosyltransferase involved in cell wall biosynthesis
MKSRFLKKYELQLPFDRGGVKVWEASDEVRLNSSPIVSVLMLAYCHEKYIAQAIDSVIAQKTNFDYEIIIGEDCSPDRSLDIALSYQQLYPELMRVISSDSNVGARKNSYRLETAARGKYIAYCECDDYWHDPQKLQIQVDFLEKNPECGLVYTNANTYNVLKKEKCKNKIPYQLDLLVEDEPYLNILTGAMHIWPLTVCVRKELSHQIIRKCPEVTDPTYAMGDTQRFLEIARCTKIEYLPISTATRNLLPESATRSISIQKKAKFIQSSQKLVLHYLDKYPLPEEKDKQIRWWVSKRALYYAYLCQDQTIAKVEMANLKTLKKGIPWKYHFYFLGSKNRFAHRMVALLLNLLNNLSKIKKGVLKVTTSNKMSQL